MIFLTLIVVECRPTLRQIYSDTYRLGLTRDSRFFFPLLFKWPFAADYTVRTLCVTNGISLCRPMQRRFAPFSPAPNCLGNHDIRSCGQVTEHADHQQPCLRVTCFYCEMLTRFKVQDDLHYPPQNNLLPSLQ